MIINRKIGKIQFGVDANTSSDILFPKNFDYSKIKGISDVLDFFHSIDNTHKPLLGIIEITNKCNFKCSFCFINEEIKNDKQKKELDFDHLINMIDYLVENGMMLCVITGGEPLMHSKFVDIYKYLKMKGVMVTVFTNASLIDEKVLKLFKQFPPYKIEVSIYSVRQSNFDKIIKNSSFQITDILKKIQNLKKDGHNVICKTVINNETKSEIKTISDWCKKNEIEYYSGDTTVNSYSGNSLQHFQIERNESIDLFERKNEIEVSDNNKKTTFSCGHGKYGFFIGYNNTLRPCWRFYQYPPAVISIEEVGIETAFKKMVKFIAINKGKPIDKCKGCYAYKMCHVCVIEHLLNSDLTDICSSVKQLYEKQSKIKQ